MPEPGFVADNSVVMAWCFSDEKTGYSIKVLSMLENQTVYVPDIWPLEAGNALVNAERRGRIKRSELLYLIEMLSNLPIEVKQETPGRMLGEILMLARDCEISTYDASYLDLAIRMSLPLATLDEKLIKAAKSCGVKTI
jgi:predicted nucleic acid-binding protein